MKSIVGTSIVLGLASTVSWLAGCGSGGVVAPGGNAALGIAAFQISQTDSRLLVVGLDAARSEVAAIEVVEGTFAMSDEFAEDRTGAARIVDGRRVAMHFGPTKLSHQSEGYSPLELPLPPDHKFDRLYAFLVDDHVKGALDRRGVAFQLRDGVATAAGETPYTTSTQCASTTCDLASCSAAVGAGLDCRQMYTNTSTNTCNTSGTASAGCAVVGGDSGGFYAYTTYVYQCCTGSIGPAEKACRPDPGQACSGSGQSTCASSYTCVNGACRAITPCGTGGSVGCAVCWNDVPYATCSVAAYAAGVNCSEASATITYTSGGGTGCDPNGTPSSDGSNCCSGAVCDGVCADFWC